MKFIYTEEGVFIKDERYKKLVIDGYYSRSGWFPIASGVPLDAEGFPKSHGFKLVQTKKGTTMFVPADSKSDTRLVFAGQVWGGFRGGASVVKDQTTAKVIWFTESSKHCKGMVAVLTIIGPNEELVIERYGRRLSRINVYRNKGGSFSSDEYEKEEWEALQETTSIKEDL